MPSKMSIKRIQLLSVIIFMAISGMLFSSCSEKSTGGMIILTRVAGKLQGANYATGDNWRYIAKSQLVAIDSEKPSGDVKVLTADFFSAHSPQISYDGKFMLFAAQQKQGDKWKIWEMNLGNFKSRLVTSSEENCIDPAYLPGGRLVFSKSVLNDPLKGGHSLYTCNSDGSGITRITFNPHTYFASKVLADGRVLAIDRQLYTGQGSSLLMVLRPDGTKSELFYKGAGATALTSGVVETAAGRILFIESDKDIPQKGNLISISYNRPLHSRVDLGSECKGDFRAVSLYQSGKLLVSYRKSEADRYGLYEFDPEKKVPGKAIWCNTEFDVLEAVVVSEHERPKKLPSEVDMGVKTGQILCQDINLTDLEPAVGKALLEKSYRIEVMGIDSLLGVVQTEVDGSFYLKVVADKPFQIRKIDKDGNIVNGPCGWMWVRPNERRGCIGCHEDHELVPENRIPLSVKKLPVAVPVHTNKVIEKKVTLE